MLGSIVLIRTTSLSQIQYRKIDLIKVKENNWLLGQVDTEGAEFINFYGDSDFKFSSDLLIHELGHMFSYRRVSVTLNRRIPEYNLEKGINWGWFTNKSSGMSKEPGKQLGAYYSWDAIDIGEVFADVFLMLVTDNNPNKTDKAYIMWSQIMEDGMPYWLNNEIQPFMGANYYPHE